MKQQDSLGEVVSAIRSQGSDYGRANEGGGRSVQVEFVSANPNGPLHLGHGRAAALGDTAARLLEWTGWRVTREYYVNDTTNSAQMVVFGRSLYVRYQQAFGRDVPLSEDGYEAEYVAELARKIADRDGDRYLAYSEQDAVRVFAEIALVEMLAQQRTELAGFGVCYDEWFSEESLHASGAVAETLSLLRASGNAYESDGALWLRATALGDDKDRVLVRATGAPTYLAADTAYHRGKFARGFERVIDVWAADHCGYVVRTRAALTALGLDPDRLEILIYQPVRLYKGGELVRMSRRAGDVIPLSDVVEEVGVDSARFHFLASPADKPLGFDIDLARKQSRENPCYSAQSAHARCCSILRRAGAAGVPMPSVDAGISLEGGDAEGEVVRLLAGFPSMVEEAAAGRRPDQVAQYALDLATAFHGFADACPAPEATAARLAVADAVRIVAAGALGLLGISAPTEMD